MNKAELIQFMSEKTGMTKEDCNNTLNVLLDTVKVKLSIGGKIQVIGFKN